MTLFNQVKIISGKTLASSKHWEVTGSRTHLRLIAVLPLIQDRLTRGGAVAEWSKALL